MHLPMAKNLPLWSGMGIIPGMTTMSTKMMKGQLDALEIPSVREMLDIIVASGGHLWGCKMSFDMNGLSEDDLYEGVEAVISATDFIELSEGAQVIFATTAPLISAPAGLRATCWKVSRCATGGGSIPCCCCAPRGAPAAARSSRR